MKLPQFRTLPAALVVTAAVFAATVAHAQTATTPKTQPATQLASQPDATEHIVPQATLEQDRTDAAAARQQQEQQIRQLYSEPQVERALRAAEIDPQQVTGAVSQLSDADLASLAARSAAAQKDFAAGNLNDHDLLIILVCIAALLLIIVAVH